ncbi:BMP family lipoprotein [Geosporobacter ferrireducens]|uniref:BMP family ABC transporter substrate-binding protein n=1 Tax=Geosporobacter ferrireducens TaxID=1424294 RepID=A0A1D8GFT1_9FIRM|nr:BMP family ABC transporter substrate-binding protein [Geosporobacter ferrireducens]AOT69764.1 BMP family ABC transporter substrate-binding protein [Geosporobacter ferrireducens]MTI54524.1 BMP family ABC transporter substrate-binding protein [Geosporobacter ferrireducens]
MKKILSTLLVLLLLVAFGLAGCTKPIPQDVQPSGGETEASEAPIKAALVVAGGLGDRSFYDSANEGIERAKKELGVEAKVLECRNDPSLFNDQLIQASQYGSVVVVVGFEFYDAIQEVAPEFPDVNYIYVDNVVEEISNITCIDYMENEGSFLAGAMAALLTQDTTIEGINKEKVIGMVGGMDISVIRNFKVGYEEGAKYIDPEIRVETIFAGDFEDPAKGKESALALYAKGADIVFQVAGKTGEGVFEAAKDSKQFAIGVDSDQRYINPDVIVASMTKGVGLSIFESIQKIQEGTFAPGSVYRYGIKENGVGIAYGTPDMKQFVSEEVKTKIEGLKEKIVSGEIKVTEIQ